MSGSNNNKNSSEETIPLAEHEALKKENETLIKMLELVEMEKKQETEKWKNKFVEMEKKVEKLENDIEELLIPIDKSEKNGMDSATAVAEENGNATSNTVSDQGVITISDDDDDDDDEGGNEGENNGGYDKPSRQKPTYSFII